MARVFITGSADGLGRMAAALLVQEGHQVVLHARSKVRAADAMKAVPGAETALVADHPGEPRRGIGLERPVLDLSGQHVSRHLASLQQRAGRDRVLQAQQQRHPAIRI